MQAVIVLAIVVAYELVRRFSVRQQRAYVGEAEGAGGRGRVRADGHRGHARGAPLVTRVPPCGP